MLVNGQHSPQLLGKIIFPGVALAPPVLSTLLLLLGDHGATGGREFIEGRRRMEQGSSLLLWGIVTVECGELLRLLWNSSVCSRNREGAVDIAPTCVAETILGGNRAKSERGHALEQRIAGRHAEHLVRGWCHAL